MKYLLLFLLLCSCGTAVYQHNLDCKLSNEELLKSITTLLLRENFQIRSSDINLGYIQAETLPQMDYETGTNGYNVFRIQINNGKIIATAQIVHEYFLYGQQRYAIAYLGDNTRKKYTWYWNIRQSLESLCGNKILITES